MITWPPNLREAVPNSSGFMTEYCYLCDHRRYRRGIKFGIVCNKYTVPVEMYKVCDDFIDGYKADLQRGVFTNRDWMGRD